MINISFIRSTNIIDCLLWAGLCLRTAGTNYGPMVKEEGSKQADHTWLRSYVPIYTYTHREMHIRLCPYQRVSRMTSLVSDLWEETRSKWGRVPGTWKSRQTAGTVRAKIRRLFGASFVWEWPSGPGELSQNEPESDWWSRSGEGLQGQVKVFGFRSEELGNFWERWQKLTFFFFF